MPASTGEIGWYQADILARAFAGVPQIDESKIDIQILGPNDLPKNPNVITLDAGYKSQFEKLWGK